MLYGEFEVIKRYFNRITNSARKDVEQGIGDDCALINIPPDHIVAVSTDTLVNNVHFLSNIHPADLAYKALAVNLSDIAAMGADPAWITLSLTISEVNEDWLSKFSDSLFEQLEYYHIQLIGGDITRGPLSVTIGIQGLVPKGCALKRSGAKRGDLIFVTGTLGDSAAGLHLLQNSYHLDYSREVYKDELVKRHLRPIPRLSQGKSLRNLATAAIDISDGLVCDLKKILSDSSVGAQVHLETLPISPLLAPDNFEYNQILKWALNGGEDYELCFTISENDCNKLNLDIKKNIMNVPCTCIGKIIPQIEGLVLLNQGNPVNYSYKGFDHFNKKS